MLCATRRSDTLGAQDYGAPVTQTATASLMSILYITYMLQAAVSFPQPVSLGALACASLSHFDSFQFCFELGSRHGHSCSHLPVAAQDNGEPICLGSTHPLFYLRCIPLRRALP